MRIVPLIRLVLGAAAVVGVLALAWPRHPDPAGGVPPLAAPPAAHAGALAPQYLLPPPPEPAVRSYLDIPERPDHLGEAAPLAARPPGLRAAPAPRRISNSPPPPVDSQAYLVMDEGSGEVLFSRNGHRRRAPASVTKIMTALLAVQRGRLDEQITVDVMGSDLKDSTLVYLTPGDQVTLRDLLYGLMLHSGNDAAVQIGRSMSGSEAAFVDLMNRRAEQLGLQDTHFANPHGLDQDGHFASAFDLAALARYAMAFPEFAAIVKAPNWRVLGPPSYGMYNGNRLLQEYEGADGVKIGATDLGGQTMVASVTRGGRRVYAVVLGTHDRIADVKKLLDYTFASFRWD